MAKRKNGGNTVSAVWGLAQPIAEDLGLEIWDIRFLKEGSQWYLRVFIDSANGITIEDCENMSRALDAPLDALDPIDVSYCLEVCSPGIERELVRPEHFQKFLGEDVMVLLVRAGDDGNREFRGKLAATEENAFTLSFQDGSTKNISKKDTVYVKLDDFNDNLGG